MSYWRGARLILERKKMIEDKKLFDIEWTKINNNLNWSIKKIEFIFH